MMMIIIIIIIIIIIKYEQLEHLKITRTILEQHAKKARNQETTKIAILCTAHILRKVLMLKYKIYFTRQITPSVAQTVNTEQLQQYVRTLDTRFVSRT